MKFFFEQSRSIFYQISPSFPVEGTCRSQSLVIFGVNNYYFVMIIVTSLRIQLPFLAPHLGIFHRFHRSQGARRYSHIRKLDSSLHACAPKIPFFFPFWTRAIKASWNSCMFTILLTGSEKDEDGLYFKGNTSVPSYHKTEDIQQSSESWDTGL